MLKDNNLILWQMDETYKMINLVDKTKELG